MNGNNIIRVRDVMSPDVKTIELTATVAEAIEMMRDTGVSSIVVERRDEDDEYGMIVVSDIAANVIGRDRAPERVNIYEVMSKPVLAVPMDMNIKYAIRLLVQFELSRALVVNDRRAPTGIVTLRDMVLRHGGES